MLKWLLRLVFIRLLGRRAVPILAFLGLISAFRMSRRDGVDREAAGPGRGHAPNQPR